MELDREHNQSAARAGRICVGVALCAALMALFLPQGVGSAEEKAEVYRELWQLEMAEEGRQHLLLEMSVLDVVVV
ncbi:MAG TPA: hypothetical protein PKE04_18090, partial [Clostridia bacterium]|nr:hypothetical protein [Clostridia bacterium]